MQEENEKIKQWEELFRVFYQPDLGQANEESCGYRGCRSGIGLGCFSYEKIYQVV